MPLTTIESREAPSDNSPDDIAMQQRARRLLRQEVAFVPNAQFGAEIARERAAGPQVTLPGATTAPRGLPGHLARMCETELLTPDAERQLFRRMNYLKFRANSLRCGLSPDWPDANAVVAVERLLAEAETIREHLIRANLRLAISIVKRFVTPQHSFDELLSDGTCALMQAVEKFDFDRGFRFSTYAYRAITCNLYRTITNRRKEKCEAGGGAGKHRLGGDRLSRARRRGHTGRRESPQAAGQAAQSARSPRAVRDPRPLRSGGRIGGSRRCSDWPIVWAFPRNGSVNSSSAPSPSYNASRANCPSATSARIPRVDALCRGPSAARWRFGDFAKAPGQARCRRYRPATPSSPTPCLDRWPCQRSPPAGGDRGDRCSQP